MVVIFGKTNQIYSSLNVLKCCMNILNDIQIVKQRDRPTNRKIAAVRQTTEEMSPDKSKNKRWRVTDSVNKNGRAWIVIVC